MTISRQDLSAIYEEPISRNRGGTIDWCAYFSRVCWEPWCEAREVEMGFETAQVAGTTVSPQRPRKAQDWVVERVVEPHSQSKSESESES